MGSVPILLTIVFKHCVDDKEKHREIGTATIYWFSLVFPMEEPLTFFQIMFQFFS
uniref:Uncharacterized protein n=1 Tax=Kuenenia stuttgartiensis TaxID=174633 RepID=Q1Q592_KUEST|nr:unknown protein [Candidatus Kuenenia stuttgartiensis]